MYRRTLIHEERVGGHIRNEIAERIKNEKSPYVKNIKGTFQKWCYSKQVKIKEDMTDVPKEALWLELDYLRAKPDPPADFRVKQQKPAHWQAAIEV